MKKHLHGISSPPHWLNVFARAKLAYQAHFRFQSHYGHEQIYLIIGTIAILFTALGIWWFFWIGERS